MLCFVIGKMKSLSENYDIFSVGIYKDHDNKFKTIKKLNEKFDSLNLLQSE